MKQLILMFVLLTSTTLALAAECRLYIADNHGRDADQRSESENFFIKKGYTIVYDKTDADLTYRTQSYIHGEYNGFMADETNHYLEGSLNDRKIDIYVKVFRFPMNLIGMVYDHFFIVKRKIRSCETLQKWTSRGEDVSIKFERSIEGF